ncbi:hypothetical protein H072_1736 [Dactylellina haptotyla CBS 200.50]|uniref:MAGE domain-containing protein n=1 Tax=Dactylellina haptotyla (strain CBS 200.50) TaxID=1284197 RepID=S8AMY0_DACHA|nr:hypothetical protein H072_1736 [Dactylellina haptotyla CBS 200.50]
MVRTVQTGVRKRPRGSQREPTREPSEEEEEEEQEEEEEEDEDEAPPTSRQRKTYASASSSRRLTNQIASRRSRAPVEEEAEEESEEEEEERRPGRQQAGLQARQRKGKGLQQRRRRRDDDDDDDEEDDEEREGNEEMEEDVGEKKGVDPVSKLVRLALAMEYQKKPIRRQDISEKVLGQQYKSDFKAIFTEAEKALNLVFGFSMVEIPAVTERITLAQQRRHAQAEAQRGGAAAAAAATQATQQAQTETAAAAAKKKKDAAGSKSWQLVSTLPDKYRLPLLHAPLLPDDQTILGIGSTIVAMVYLSNRAISEETLKRHLRKFNVEDRIPVEGNRENGKMENIMAKLIREGYLVKLKDEVIPGQEQTYTYVVGPRGKLELGRQGVTEFVRRVYEGCDGEVDEGFERRVNRAIGKDDGKEEKAQGGDNGEEEEGSGRGGAGAGRRGGRGGARGGGRGGRRRRAGDSEEEEEESE